MLDIKNLMAMLSCLCVYTKFLNIGLQLKYHDQLAAITFGLLPRVATYVPIEWQRVVTEDLEDQHIRCHMLQFGDKLRTLMTSFKEANAIAVILINTSASLCIAPQYLEGALVSLKCTIKCMHVYNYVYVSDP